MASKSKTKDELQKELHEKHEALKNFRFGITGSKVRNVREGRNLRKDIARIETALKNAQ
jgi:ribosomal protein L29